MNSEVIEITYKQTCIAEAGNNLIKEFLCGEAWQQTRINTAILFTFTIVMILLLIYFLIKRNKKI